MISLTEYGFELRSKRKIQYLEYIKTRQLVFALGPAGSGKTWIPATFAAHALLQEQIKEIVLIRPRVHAGEEDHGFLPGKLEAKAAPWAEPLMAAMREVITSKNEFDRFLHKKAIRVEPIGYMRGKTFKNCLILVDEAENCSYEILKLILTRPGHNSVIVINGDVKQSDIETRFKSSGLGIWFNIAKTRLTDIAGIVEFTIDDCERSELCRRVLDAADDYESRQPR